MGFAGVVGHEFVGVVESAPAGHEALVGKRVVGDINLVCGDTSNCFTCACGYDRARNHCPKRTVLGIVAKDGTYQERLTMPVQFLHVVPDHVSSENAAFMEPLAAAFRIVEQQLVKKEDKVAVVGDGKLGLLITEVCSAGSSASSTTFSTSAAGSSAFSTSPFSTGSTSSAPTTSRSLSSPCPSYCRCSAATSPP